MKVEIKEPCHENWDSMKIGLISRYCDSCEKSVMDFTTMSRGEIITYMLSNPNDSVCGRMRQDQFDFQHKDIPVLIEALKKHRPSNSFMILALVCMSLASCSDEPTGNISTPSPINTKVEVVDTDANKDTLVEVTNDSVVEQIIEPFLGQTIVHPDPPVPMPVGIMEMGEVMPIMPDPHIIEPPIVEPHEPGGGMTPGPKDDPLVFAEKMPEFDGGVAEMMKFIQDHLKYPRYERNSGIEGNVYVKFVVEKDGSLTSPEILKSVTGSKNFDSEVLRILDLMPNWIPGENRGKTARVYMTLPFRFKLTD